MYGGLSSKCVGAATCNLSQTCNQLVPDAVAKIWPAPVPDKRLPQLGGDVSHALAPRKCRFRCLVRTHMGR